MKTLSVNTHKLFLGKSFTNTRKTQLVSPNFFHNAIIAWTLFVGILVVLFWPVIVIAYLARVIRSLF